LNVDLLQPRFSELRSIFRAYACGTISAAAGANDEMDMEEFNDFAIECTGLITKEYGFNVMANQFSKSDGLSSKDKVLDLIEFVALLVRISFYRANPAFGLLAKDAQSASRLAEHAVQLATLPRVDAPAARDAARAARQPAPLQDLHAARGP